MNAYLIEKLREGRKAAGLKLRDVEEISGINSKTISLKCGL